MRRWFGRNGGVRRLSVAVLLSADCPLRGVASPSVLRGGVLAAHNPAAFFAVAGSGGDVPNGLPPRPPTLGPACCWDTAICSDGSSPRGQRGDYISCPPCSGGRKAVRSRLSMASSPLMV